MLFARLIFIISLFSILLTSCSESFISGTLLLDESKKQTVQSYIPAEHNNSSDKDVVNDNNNAQFAHSSEDDEFHTNNPANSDPIILMAEYYSGEFQTGYRGEYNNNIVIDLTFTVELDKTVYHRGDKVTLHVDVQNIGSAFMYVPDYSSPDALLRHEEYINGKNYSKGYTTYNIYRGDIIIPEGFPNEKLCETGSTWGNTVVINIPANALSGLYDIIVFSHGYTAIVEDALEIIH